MSRVRWEDWAWPPKDVLEAELVSARAAWRYEGPVRLAVCTTWWDIFYGEPLSYERNVLASSHMHADTTLAELASELLRLARKAAEDIAEGDPEP